MTNKKEMILKDKNGIELKTGQIVKIEGGFFKSDNGNFKVIHSPGDIDWSGNDYCLYRVNNNGTISKSKNKTQFWPLIVTVTSREKRLEAREHNAKHATIEIIDNEVEERETKQVAEIEEIEPVEEMAEEKEVTGANSEPETKVKTDTAIEISFNEEKNGIEIKFTDKPDRAVLENLKANGFRWSRYQKIWYAKDTEERREFIKQFEGAEIGAAGPKVFEYPEININDLDSYRVDPELSRRENDSSWIFRSKERNHNEEIKTILEGYQTQAIEILNLTDDEETIYYVKRDLQRFKKAYHTNYIARLTNKANNPSWAVTGRSGRNASRDQKAIDRYDNLMRESIELVENFEKNLYRYRSRIRKVAKKNQQQEIENTNIEIDFKVETKEINYLNAKQKVRTYNYKNYTIAKLWGCFRIFKDGKELSTRIVDLRTTDTLKTAKKAVQRLVNEENEELQKVI